MDPVAMTCSDPNFDVQENRCPQNGRREQDIECAISLYQIIRHKMRKVLRKEYTTRVMHIVGY
jgi:hypothetical protein